jgi:two-component system OmpR family sensor kinase
VDVGEVIGQCLDSAEALGASHSITIQRSGPRVLWCRIAASRLRSVLMNLLGNAVEHNRPNGTVEVSWLHDGQQLRIRISDNGPGIDSEHLPHVFSPFYRGDRGAEHGHGHLGLGLFIVQSHVKAMGGVCRIDSEVGRGTVIEVELPCQKTAEPATQQQKLATSSN